MSSGEGALSLFDGIMVDNGHLMDMASGLSRKKF